MDNQEHPHFTKLVPILFVSDLEAEKQFYLNLGFRLSYEGDEFPGFIGMSFGDHIEFGLELKDGFDATKLNDSMVWQFETTSMKTVIATCNKHGYEIVQQPTQAKEDFPCFEMKIKSPNGYHVQIEAGKDDTKD